jgi:hypothetical protein
LPSLGVRRPSVNFSYFNLDQMEPNLAESIYIRSSIKFLHFVPFRQQIWPPRAPDNFDMFFGHIFFVILDILKIFCSNKHQIITDLLNYLDPIKS